jgi:putative ABC transport system permease protein
MMHKKTMIQVAFKYLSGHFRRFVFLFIAISFGFAVITIMTSLSEGMSRNILTTARNHYAGHVFIIGYDKDARTQARITRTEFILNSIEKLDLSPEKIVMRTSSFAEGTLYFAGTAVRQKYVYGIEWEKEKADFKKISFSSGGVENVTGNNWILISRPVAEELNVRIGDDLILEVITRTGQRNTGDVIVKGIIEDTSVFGYYKCFADRHYLNNLLGYDEKDASIIGLYFHHPGTALKKSREIYIALKKYIPMGPPISKKSHLTHQLSRDWEGIRYFIFPLHVYISQIIDLLSAMEIISYILYIMIICIIIVSILVTYRLILHERSAEIATMQAMGFREKDVILILVMEALILFLFALVAGFLFASLVLWILSFFSFSWIPGFEILLNNGKLTGIFSPGVMLINIVILLIFTIPAVCLPSLKLLRKDLTMALSGRTL